MGNIFTILLINPIFNLLLVFLYVFSTWHIPGSLGLAIIALTASFRVVSAPFYKKQMMMSAQMEELRPKLEEIQKKYKKDPKRVQQEQLKLYQERGINPAAGCLVAIIQIPLVIALYQVLLNVFKNNNLSHIVATTSHVAYFDFLKVTRIDPWFLGFNLGVSPSHFRVEGYHYLIIPLLTAFLQYYSVTLTMPAPKKKEPVAPKKGDKDVLKPQEESFQEVFQKQSKVMFPLMIGYFSYILPVGLALYWNIFSLFSILQAKEKNKHVKAN